MFENIENLKIESILHKISSSYGKINKRKVNTFNIRVSGSMKYYFKDKNIMVNKGEMIFIPKGASYEYKTASAEDSICTIINLHGDFGDAKPTLYPLKDFYDADYVSYNFADLWKLGDQSEKYKCLSIIYNLLSYITNLEKLRYEDKKKFFIIEPALNYLKKHIYDSNLKIDELHRLCGISNTYFRNIFIAKFGVSPKKYIVEKRILQAKSIIDSGEFNTVKELSLSVGYKDALYFGKVFKNHYGISPLKMSK